VNKLKIYLEKLALALDEPPSTSTVDSIAEILIIQNQNAFQNATSASKGFLVTLWTLQDVINILRKGAYVWLARNEDTHLLHAYLVVSGIDLFLESIQVPEVSIIKDINPKLLTSKTLYLYQLAVTLDLRRSGLGSKLISHVLATEKTSFVADIMKWPHYNLASYSLLEKFGFRISGEVHHSHYRNFGACHWLVMGLFPR
jgi:ribosomal protein S18 acetylase RimI-like enzyme